MLRKCDIFILGLIRFSIDRFYDDKFPRNKLSYKLRISGIHNFELDDETKLHMDKISEEWICGLKGEKARVLICLNLLRADLLKNIKDTFDIFLRTFRGIYEQIRSK